MKKILIALTLTFTTSANALQVANYCGSYASVIPGIGNYEIFSNSTPDTRALCPGSGCPGIVKYSGTYLDRPTYKGIVANNSIINDVFEADGVTLAAKRMFTRNVIAKDGLGYVAIAFVSNNYPPTDNTVVPAWLTSPNGVNWTYHGKLKGEAAGKIFWGSGMALVVSDTGPRYTFWTDGYGVKLARLTSDGFNDWKITMDSLGNVQETKPAEWGQGLFHSAAYIDGIYYLTAADKWPVTKWLYAHSFDGINWIHDREQSVTSVNKNVSYYVDNGALMGLATIKIDRNCYRKDIRYYPEL